MTIETESDFRDFLGYIRANCEIPDNVAIKVSVPASVISELVCPYFSSISPNNVPRKVEVYYLGIRVELENTDKKIESSQIER